MGTTCLENNNIYSVLTKLRGVTSTNPLRLHSDSWSVSNYRSQICKGENSIAPLSKWRIIGTLAVGSLQPQKRLRSFSNSAKSLPHPGERPDHPHARRPYGLGQHGGGDADGCRTVSASRDQTLRLWDLESGKEIAAFTGESDMSSCAIAPDGRTFLAGDGFGRLHFLRLVEAADYIGHAQTQRKEPGLLA